MVIAAPPSDVGAVSSRVTDRSPGVPAITWGASATVRGVAMTKAEAAPDPTALTARRRRVSALPLVKPTMVTGDVVLAGLRAVQVEPPLVEYS